MQIATQLMLIIYVVCAYVVDLAQWILCLTCSFLLNSWKGASNWNKNESFICFLLTFEICVYYETYLESSFWLKLTKETVSFLFSCQTVWCYSKQVMEGWWEEEDQGHVAVERSVNWPWPTNWPVVSLTRTKPNYTLKKVTQFYPNLLALVPNKPTLKLIWILIDFI